MTVPRWVLVALALAAATCFRPSACMNFVQQQTNRKILSAHRVQIGRDNATDIAANLTLYFFPETAYNIREDQVMNISFAYSLQGTALDLNATFRLDNPRVAVVLNADFLFEANTTVDPSLEQAALLASGNATLGGNESFAGQLPFSLQVRGAFLGRADLTLLVRDPTSSRDLETSLRYRVSVIRKRRLVDDIVQFAMWIFVVLANVGMGCELDMRVVKAVMKKPVAPILGFISQYLFMPMISFCVLLIIDLPASTALGYFGVGCAPGGGASNFYCLLLGGDISLSITMTLISTLAALGVTPMYMLTLGQYILKSRNFDIQIPYANIVISLLLILVPTAIGYIIKVRLPKVAKVYRKVLKPAVLVFVVFMFTVGVYANLFIWQLFSPAIIAAGCALPYAGFLLGGILAAIFRQPWPYVKTISLETGIQNPGVPILILQTSLPQPDADLSLVGPFAAATFTPMPLLIWVAGRALYYKFYLKRSMFAKPQHEDSTAEIDITNRGGGGGGPENGDAVAAQTEEETEQSLIAQNGSSEQAVRAAPKAAKRRGKKNGAAPGDETSTGRNAQEMLNRGGSRRAAGDA